MKTTARVLLLLVLALTVACQGPASVLTPQRAWVDADRSFHGVIGLRFKGYVNADTTLDPLTRDVLLRSVDDWDFMIRQAEATLPPASAAPPAPTPAAAAPEHGDGGGA